VALWERAGIVVVRATQTIRERETTTTRANTIEPFFMHTPTTTLTLCLYCESSSCLFLCLSFWAEVMKISPSKERKQNPNPTNHETRIIKKKKSNGKKRGKKKKSVFVSSDSIAKSARALSLSHTHTPHTMQ
jgi:hypothetical protein